MPSMRSAVRTLIDSLTARVAAEIRAGQIYQRDRAHGATCDDRPFVGCGPCQPAALARPVVARENPAAMPRR